jgi:hypothetical protein
MSRFLLLVTAAFCLAAPAVGQIRFRQLGTEVVWHGNVTNAERPEDLLAALQWRTEVRCGGQRSFAGGHRLLGSAGVRTELWPRFEGLNVLAPGLAGAWEFKPGLGPHRPVFAAEVEGEWVAAAESARQGRGAAGRLSVRQRLGSSWLVAAGHDWRRFDAQGRAFDRTGREWQARVAWSAGPFWSLAAEGRARVGDVVSYSRPPRPDLAAIGKPVTLVETFEQGVPWIAYYFRARTRSAAVEVQRTLGRSVLTLRHEYRHTLHAGPGYENHLTSLRFTATF